jgi:anti-sigma regulatory factor (Ser/Thr protein kinase)
MEYTIKLIQASDDNWIKQLSEHRKYCEEKHITKVCIDLDGLTFLSPQKVVSLACLIELYSINNKKIDISRGTYDINKYITNIKFCDYWSEGFSRDEFTQLTTNTTFCLWHVKKTMIDSYANEAHKYFQNAYFQGKNLESLHLALTEVFNNIFDHSQSQIQGYVLTQCFPNVEKIAISVCDFGLGIAEKINQLWSDKGRERMSDNDALRAALFRKITSQSTPQNRGFGLANLYDIVLNLKGIIEIRSNRAVLTIHSDGTIKSYLSNHFFAGTLILVTLEKRYLPDIEEMIADEEFNF